MINGSHNGIASPLSYPTRDQCIFELWTAPDASPIVLAPEANESKEDVKELEQGIAARVKAGDVWAWAIVVVIARWGEYGGMACIGQVSASSAEDFAHPENEDYVKLQDDAYERLIENIAKRYKAHVFHVVSPDVAKDTPNE
jgi:hypothetical protein